MFEKSPELRVLNDLKAAGTAYVATSFNVTFNTTQFVWSIGCLDA